MSRYRVLLKRVERLSAAVFRDSHPFLLKDGTRATLSFQQISKGSVDLIGNVRSYEAYVMDHALSSSSEWGTKALEMIAEVRPPIPPIPPKGVPIWR